MIRSSRDPHADRVSDEVTEPHCGSATVRSAPSRLERAGFSITTPSGTVPFEPLASADVLCCFARHIRARQERTPGDPETVASIRRRRRALLAAARGALADARQWLSMHTVPVDAFPGGLVLEIDREDQNFLDDEIATVLETTAAHLRQVDHLLAFRESLRARPPEVARTDPASSVAFDPVSAAHRLAILIHLVRVRGQRAERDTSWGDTLISRALRELSDVRRWLATREPSHATLPGDAIFAADPDTFVLLEDIAEALDGALDRLHRVEDTSSTQVR